MSVFIIADPGAAHLMDLETAQRLTIAVAEAGADAIKWQVYRADSLYVPGEYHDIVKRFEFPLEWLPVLAAAARWCDIEFMASAFSKELYDAVDPYVKRHKIASLESGDDELIAHVVAKGKPVIVSTGASDWKRMQELGSWGKTALGPNYHRTVPTTLLHCVTAYPAPVEDANMSVLFDDAEMGRGCDGLSDHSAHPTLLPVMAVALGATVIEKHIRLEDTPIDNPDYPHSLSPSQFREMVDAVRMAELAMGDGQKRVMASEGPLSKWKRKPGMLRGA